MDDVRKMTREHRHYPEYFQQDESMKPVDSGPSSEGIHPGPMVWTGCEPRAGLGYRLQVVPLHVVDVNMCNSVPGLKCQFSGDAPQDA